MGGVTAADLDGTESAAEAGLQGLDGSDGTRRQHNAFETWCQTNESTTSLIGMVMEESGRSSSRRKGEDENAMYNVVGDAWASINNSQCVCVGALSMDVPSSISSISISNDGARFRRDPGAEAGTEHAAGATRDERSKSKS